MVTLRGAWPCEVSAKTGQSGVSFPLLGEIGSLICSFYLGVTACKLAVPEIHFSSCLDVKQPRNNSNCLNVLSRAS